MCADTGSSHLKPFTAASTSQGAAASNQLHQRGQSCHGFPVAVHRCNIAESKSGWKTEDASNSPARGASHAPLVVPQHQPEGAGLRRRSE